MGINEDPKDAMACIGEEKCEGKCGEREVYHGCGSSQSSGFELISFTRPSEVQAASALPCVGNHVTYLGKLQSGQRRHTLPTCENATVSSGFLCLSCAAKHVRIFI